MLRQGRLPDRPSLRRGHVSNDHLHLIRFERLLSRITRVAPGEGRTAFLFFLHGFQLLSSCQAMKALREAFMLAKFLAETRAYAVALMAVVLMVAVPLYDQPRHHLEGAQLLRAVTLLFVVTLPLFAVPAHLRRFTRSGAAPLKDVSAFSVMSPVAFGRLISACAMTNGAASARMGPPVILMRVFHPASEREPL